MESLKIRTGLSSLKIVDDAGEERGIFTFNPEDIESAKRVIGLQAELERKQAEFDSKAESCETDEEKIDLLCEAVECLEDLIDKCFGAGTSALLFGDAKTLTMFSDFFEGITPYYEKASKERMSKYAKKPAKK